MSCKKRILIIGGVAGGASAAARARRLAEDAEIVLFERGESISFANCGMPYYIGGVIAHRERLLVQTPQGMRRRYRIDVRTRTEVVRIDRAAKTLFVRDLETGRESAEPYDALILSPGAEPVRPPIPGLDSKGVFTLRNLKDMDAIKQAAEGATGVSTPRDGTPARTPTALIIGGGYIGLEMAEALREKGLGVILVEFAGQVFALIDPEMAEPVHQHLRAKGVDLRLGTAVTGIREEALGLRAALSDGREVACALVIVAVGIRPESKLAKEAGLAVGPSGGIVVDDHMRTSDPAIFAVGDAVETPDFVSGRSAVIPLAGPANRQARVAADNAVGRDSAYRKGLGTAICKVFDLAVGATGLGEKALRRQGIPYQKVYVHAGSHAGYFPDASPMTLKLLFDPTSGKVLGAQAVGHAGIDKRIDVLAVAIRAGMTVFDLEDLDLAYAPPYGSARDPVNHAGYVAANSIRGDLALCHSEDVAHPREDQLVLDVRTAPEVQAGTIPGAINIPIDELRDRMGELPKDKEILAFCRVGQRAYVACRILGHNGFRCRDLTGGYLTYQAAVKGRGEGILPSRVAGVSPACVSSSSSSSSAASASSGAASPAENQADSPEETHHDTGDEGDGENQSASPAPRAADAKEFRVDDIVKEIDCTHMQCPGPILKLRDEIAAAAAGQSVAIVAADPGFPADVEGWCRSTGNRLVELKAVDGGLHRAVVAKGLASAAPGTATGGAPAAAPAQSDLSKVKTMVVFSGDLDRVMASFIIANGAAALGSRVTMFFTFWGLNVLRRDRAAVSGKSLIEKMFGWMMPRGPGKLKLSKMNLAGMGTAMMKGRMKSRNVPSLPQLIDSARKAGVKLVACAMSMDVMGLRKEELIDGVDYGGVASFLSEAQQGNVTLFI